MREDLYSFDSLALLFCFPNVGRALLRMTTFPVQNNRISNRDEIFPKRNRWINTFIGQTPLLSIVTDYGVRDERTTKKHPTVILLSFA